MFVFVVRSLIRVGLLYWQVVGFFLGGWFFSFLYIKVQGSYFFVSTETKKNLCKISYPLQYIKSHDIVFKVILHQFWVKNFFPWKFNLEYGGTFTKLFMHVSSQNMFPSIRNLQICVQVYRPRHCCGDWLTFGCFVPMIADHDLVTKR